mgnify:CR=1 FL=1
MLVGYQYNHSFDNILIYLTKYNLYFLFRSFPTSCFYKLYYVIIISYFLLFFKIFVFGSGATEKSSLYNNARARTYANIISLKFCQIFQDLYFGQLNHFLQWLKVLCLFVSLYILQDKAFFIDYWFTDMAFSDSLAYFEYQNQQFQLLFDSLCKSGHLLKKLHSLIIPPWYSLIWTGGTIFYN